MKDNQNTSYGKLQKTSKEFKDSYNQELKDLDLNYNDSYNDFTYKVEGIFSSVNKFVECIGRQEDTNAYINERTKELERLGYIRYY